MKKGFFSSSSYKSETKIPTLARCGTCGLYRNCKSPKMPPTGKGKRKILIVAEAPGEQEDRHNTQLIGKAGQELRRCLRKTGIDLDRDCWKTNAVICRRKENQTPDDSMIEACRPNLIKTIKLYQPNAIILLGKVAIKSLLSVTYKDVGDSVSKWAGFHIPCHDPNTWITPTYHPSYLLRQHNKVLDKMFVNHLKEAVRKAKSKPWDTPPVYKDQIEVIMDTGRVSTILSKMIKKGGPVAFDYETNCLKPDGEGTEIVSCSVCWKGKKTIAFPFKGEVIPAVEKLTRSSLPKIASNLKFEDRWTKAFFKHPVKNWWWDTMIAAHVLNNAPGITSIKYQAFVLLGQKPYDEHISPFLKSTKGSRFNRIHEIDLEELLIYNGMDSLLEYKVAIKQMKSMRTSHA